jgi:hypothetical protein
MRTSEYSTVGMIVYVKQAAAGLLVVRRAVGI